MWKKNWDLISFWQQASFHEALESTECPETGVFTWMIEAFTNIIGNAITSNLSHIVIEIESWLVIEKSETTEDTTNVTWSWSFGFEDFISIFCDDFWRNSQLSDTLTTCYSQIFRSFYDVISWCLCESKLNANIKLLNFNFTYLTITYSSDQNSNDEKFHYWWSIFSDFKNLMKNRSNTSRSLCKNNW